MATDRHWLLATAPGPDDSAFLQSLRWSLNTPRGTYPPVALTEISRTQTFFLLYAAWVRSRAERPSVSYTKVVMEVAWTGHDLQFTKTN